MSTEENKAILHRAVTCYNNLADRSGYFDLYDAHAVVHGYQGVEPGLESIQQFYYTFWAAFPDSRLTLEDVLAEGDKVAARYVVHGTHQGKFMGVAPTGKQITRTGITILRFRDGKCVERWSQADTLGMMQQLGVIS